jgi:hypothetical protein
VAAADRLLGRVWPGRRRELVTTLRQADGMAVSLRIYWNRGLEEVRGTLDASDVDSGVVQIRSAEMTVSGDARYASDNLAVRVKDIWWVTADGRQWGPF